LWPSSQLALPSLLPRHCGPRCPDPFPTRRSSDLESCVEVTYGDGDVVEVEELHGRHCRRRVRNRTAAGYACPMSTVITGFARTPDRKSTRLNSSHVKISYAVFCLKKKKKTRREPR